MALTNKLVKQVDLPVWEWMRFTPVTTASTTALTTARDGTDRYLYYFGNATLYRYDTWGDNWQLLSTNATPVGALAVQYTKNQGFSGQVIATPANNQLRIPSTNGANMVGMTIQIVSGTGAGQERTITAAAAETVHESGVATTASTTGIIDTTRRWKMNQWLGYSAKIVFNTGFSQYRNVIYSNENSFQVFDASYDARAPWMSVYSSLAPYAPPNATAGSQANFEITSQVITVNTNWTVNPDSTSRFKILSGGIWFLTQNSVSPFFQWYYYDLLSDNFINRLNPAGIFGAAVATDWAVTPFSDKLLSSLETGTATSGSSKNLVDTSKTWTKGAFNEFYVDITGGTGVGQSRRIASNSTDTLLVSPKWDTPPDNTSTYAITCGDDVIFAGNGRAQLLQYLPGPSIWSTGNVIDFGLVPSQLAVTRATGRLPHAISTATRNLNGITAVNATPTAAGINYSVGDLLTITTGGTLGRVYVESINPQTGAVLTVSLYTCGTNYTVGTGRATSGGTGSGCTIEITSVGTIGVFTTSINHDIILGESVTFVGATEAAWNTTYAVLGMQSQTVFEAITTATASAVSLYAQATSLLVDNTRSWTPNEFTGKLLGIQSNGLAGAITWRRILGNSATTISFIAGTAPTNGNSRYFIQDLEAFGKDKMFLADTQGNQGYATAGAIGSLTDSTKNWYPAAFNGTKIEVQNIDGTRMEDIIAFNSATVLTTGVSVAVGSGTNTIAYSYDKGLTWTGLGLTIFTTNGFGMAWNGTRFVGVGNATNTIAYSDNGVNWVGLGATIFTTQGNGIAWNGVRFVAVGSGTNTIAWSNDGATWNGLGATTFSTAGNGVAWSGTRWVAVGQGTNTLAYSTDGVTWTPVAGIFTTAGNGVCWAGTQFIAVGQGTNTIATSTDGITWVGLGTTTFSTLGKAVVWNGTTAVAMGSGTNTMAYSIDNGATWTGLGTTVFTTQGYGVFWNGTNFIAGGQGTNTIAYSATGQSAFTPVTGGTSLFSSLSSGGAATTPLQSVVPNIGVVPTANSLYRIMDSFGSSTSTGSTTALNDGAKKWKVNQWAGKRLILTSGTGVQNEVTITANTATQLQFGAQAFTPDASTTYTIIGKPAVGAGIQLMWNWGSSDTTTKGKYLFLPRGGASHTIDRYNISTNMWEYGWFIFGQGETLTTGSMYAYDGDRIYYHKDATGRIFYYDIVKNEINSFGFIPYGMGAAILGNRMEIVKTADNLKYLYIMRHTGTEMWRTIIIF